MGSACATRTPAREPWATSVHAAQSGARLLNALLEDLSGHAKTNAQPQLLPPRPAATPVASIENPAAKSAAKSAASGSGAGAGGAVSTGTAPSLSASDVSKGMGLK